MVIAIIGILVSLLLPAVQQAREAARRTACTNNVRQLALGYLNYESGLRFYPDGFIPISGDNTPTPFDDLFVVSWILQIGGQIEAQSVLDLITARAESSPGITMVEEMNFDGIPQLDGVLCPSMQEPEKILPFASGYGPGDGPPVTMPGYLRTDYTRVMGYASIIDWDDFRPGAGFAWKARQIRDGMSKTFLMGESRGTVVNGRREEAMSYVSTFDLAINWATDVDLSFIEPSPFLNPFQDLDGNTRYSYEQFSSPHSQIVTFAMFDGSVHSISRDIESSVLIGLSTIGHGEIVAGF